MNLRPRRNRKKRAEARKRTFNLNIGRNRTHDPKKWASIKKAPGVVTCTRAPKAITNPGPHFRFGAVKGKTPPNSKWRRRALDPGTVEDYYSIHNHRGEYHAFLYDYNVYSADGSAWLAYFDWAYHWNFWILYGTDNFPEGVLFHYNRLGASSGPHRRYQLLHRPSFPVRPPVPPFKPHIPEMPYCLDPENMWDLEFWNGRGLRVGPGDMCNDENDYPEKRREFVPTRRHSMGVVKE